MTTLLTVGSGAAVAEEKNEFSSPAVNVHSSAMVGWVDGEATMSDNGNAVGFEETSVNGTSGGGDRVDDGAAVTVPAAAESVAAGVAAESVA